MSIDKETARDAKLNTIASYKARQGAGQRDKVGVARWEKRRFPYLYVTRYTLSLHNDNPVITVDNLCGTSDFMLSRSSRDSRGFYRALQSISLDDLQRKLIG